MKKIILLSLITFTATSLKAQIQADFSAEEAMTDYYEQGWDDISSFGGWTLKQTNSKNTWELTDKSLYNGQQPFSNIDSSSKYSLGIIYDSNSYQDERITSPAIHIKDNSSTEFYSLFSAVWLFNADWTFSIIDTEANDTTQLVSGFKWSQDQAFTGPSWVKFHFDLFKYANKDCKFEFRYRGTGGDNVEIDGFRIQQKDTSATAVITINEGDSVHYIDQSTGTPTAWDWTFDGGTPSKSTQKNPVINYAKAGVYNVRLTAASSTSTSTVSHNNYITVKVQAPTAHIGLPANSYLSPWVACFVPTNVPVHFRDLSTGNPNSWSWTFAGGTPSTSFDQNPSVVYEKEGIYGYTLDVSNSVGTSNDFMVKAIQAGGSQDIWNIEPDEYDKMGTTSLGLYGYYAGTNWLGMVKFAEAFARPAAPAKIDSISVYFDKVSTITPDTLISVSVCLADASGMPGEPIASASVKASDLSYDKSNIVATKFRLDQVVNVDSPFFVVISGIPHASTTSGKDDISILTVLREEGKKTTTYHLLEEWDDKNLPTGKYQWYKNIDSPLSMAVTAHLTYPSSTSASIHHTASTPFIGKQTAFGVNGISRNTFTNGISIMRMPDGTVKKVMVK